MQYDHAHTHIHTLIKSWCSNLALRVCWRYQKRTLRKHCIAWQVLRMLSSACDGTHIKNAHCESTAMMKGLQMETHI